MNIERRYSILKKMKDFIRSLYILFSKVHMSYGIEDISNKHRHNLLTHKVIDYRSICAFPIFNYHDRSWSYCYMEIECS